MNKLNYLTISQTIEGLKKGEFSSVDVTRACLEQINAFDDEINAFVTVTKEEALKRAKVADELLAKEGIEAFERYPLLGVPYACKDNFSTKDILTTASSNVLNNYVPPYESTVTHRLSKSGAVLLGKTNMDAFAHGSSTESSDFFVTKNPWDVKRVPGGSSGGSAAAVAANMCIFAIGSETAGSIRCPASWCGVTGFKPTYGRVSRYGVIAMASSTDSPGPITKDVLDSALVLQVIAGKDPFDATSSTQDTQKYADKLTEDISKVKIGVPKSYFDVAFEKGVKEIVMKAIDEYKKMGASIVEIELLDPKYSIAVYTIVQRSEVSSNLARFDGIRFGNDRDSFGYEAKKRMLLGAYSLSEGYYAAFYSKAQKVRTLIINDFSKAFSNVDLIIGPTMPMTALKIGDSEKYPAFGEIIDELQEPSSIAGLTAVSLPCGFVNDLPVGFQLIGNQFDEQLVFNAAYAFQQRTDYHRKFSKLGE